MSVQPLDTAQPTPPPSPERVWLIAVAMALVVMALLFAGLWPCDCVVSEQPDVEPMTLPLVKPTVVPDNVLAGYVATMTGVKARKYVGML